MGAGYSPFTVDPLSGGYQINSIIGTVFLPGDALLAGVNVPDLSTQFQALVGLDPAAVLVAGWATGRHAIAYNVLSGGNAVIGLNYFPTDSYGLGNAQLLSNAINFQGTPGDPSQVPEPMTLSLFGAGLAGIGWARRRKA